MIDFYLKKIFSMAPLTRCVAGSKQRNLRTDDAIDDDDFEPSADEEEADEHMAPSFFSSFSFMFCTFCATDLERQRQRTEWMIMNHVMDHLSLVKPFVVISPRVS